jgi:hypothetical protein
VKRPMQVLGCNPEIVHDKPSGLCDLGDAFNIRVGGIPHIKPLEEDGVVYDHVKTRGRLGFLQVLDEDSDRMSKAYLVVSFDLEREDLDDEEHTRMLKEYEASTLSMQFHWYFSPIVSLWWSQSQKGWTCRTLSVSVGKMGSDALWESLECSPDDWEWLAVGLLPRMTPGSIRRNTLTHFHLFIEL